MVLYCAHSCTLFSARSAMITVAFNVADVVLTLLFSCRTSWCR